MATAESQKMDDIILSIVAMGFAAEDAEDAIKSGFFTTELAVDWILLGKPPVCDARLNLRQRTPAGVVPSSSPFVDVQPTLLLSNESKVQDQLPDEPALVSRLSVDDSRREEQRKFEKKKFEEAKKKAMQEKFAQKQERKRILAQIQDDQAGRQNRMQLFSDRCSTTKQDTSSKKPFPSNSTNKCMVQIRFPNGKCLRNAFETSSVLKDVCDFAIEKFPKYDASRLILSQSFPKRVFSPAELYTTLYDLGLCPSCSLFASEEAVKVGEEARQDVNAEPIEEARQDVVPDPIEEAMQDVVPDPIEEVMHDMIPDLIEEARQDVIPDLIEDARQDVIPDQHEEARQDVIPDLIEARQDVIPDLIEARQDVIPDPLEEENPNEFRHAMLENILENPNANDLQIHDQFVPFVGRGELLNANLGERPAHREQMASELARAAAIARYRHAPIVSHSSPDVASAGRAAGTEVTTLKDLLISHLVTHVKLSGVPGSMNGLPAVLAQQIIAQLIKQRQLKPAMLNCFISCRLFALSFDCYCYATNELMAALRPHKFLTHLNLKSCNLIAWHGFMHLSELTHLKVLSFDKCQNFNDQSMKLFRELSALTTLSLEGTRVTSAGIALLASFRPLNLASLTLAMSDVSETVFLHLSDIPSLRYLNLAMTQIKSLEDIGNLENLEYLDISGTLISTGDLHEVVKLSALHSLNIASLPNVNGDDALRVIKDMKLASLTLPDRNSITDVGVQQLSEIPLVTLNLANFFHVTDTGIQALSNMNSLSVLHLNNTKMSDVGAHAVSKLYKLEQLFCDRTLLTSQGAAVFFKLKNLTELSLSETSVTDELLKMKVLNSMICLRKLNLSRNNITSKGLLHLHHPLLKSLNLEGTFAVELDEITLKEQCSSLETVLLRNLRIVTLE